MNILDSLQHAINGLDNWLIATFQISLGGLVAWVGKKIQKYFKQNSNERNERMKKIEKTNDLLTYAIRAQQKESIYKSTEKYILQGFITLPELDTLNSMYKSYKALGGDDSTDLRVEKCKDLPLHESADSELDGVLENKGIIEEHNGVIELGGKEKYEN